MILRSPLRFPAYVAAPALLALAGTVTAQSPPDLLSVDYDFGLRVHRDLDGDGKFHGPNEVTSVESTSPGAASIDLGSDAAWGVDGAVYVSGQSGKVWRLLDANTDGDFADAGESAVWFDGSSPTNATGTTFNLAFNLSCSNDGSCLVALRSSAGSGTEVIARLEDLNGDGDAMDPSEARVLFPASVLGPPPPGAWLRDAVIGPDGALYAMGSPSPGLTRGVYRVTDVDGNGTLEASEGTLFFEPPLGPFASPPARINALELDDDGRFLLLNQTVRSIDRFVDSDADGVIDAASESESVWNVPAWRPSYTGTVPLNGVAQTGPGTLVVTGLNSTTGFGNPTNGIVLRLVDRDGDGRFVSGSETRVLFSDQAAPTPTSTTTGIIPALSPALLVSEDECSPATLHSSGLPGSASAIGSTSIAEGDLTLEAADLPPGQFGFFLASRTSTAPMPVANSQGQLCLSSSIGRYSRPGEIGNSGSQGRFSLALDPLALRRPMGDVAALPGETWFFQAWFRDVNPFPTSNFTSAVRVTFSN